MQTTFRAPNLLLTFFLILIAVVQPLLAAPVEVSAVTPDCVGKDCKDSAYVECTGKDCQNPANIRLKMRGANTVSSKFTRRDLPLKKNLKKRSQMTAELKKRLRKVRRARK
ncbi:hypothetical protein TWF694_009885 [Orbilia ellipsospora]|uniref:Uncharacterized protein n=1 Tax=Orbilia ellipsospora TaxID=2528407 RepID=A0AAV9XDD1_9PEZI